MPWLDSRSEVNRTEGDLDCLCISLLFVFAVVVTSLSKISYTQPNCCGCCIRNYFRHLLVLDMEFFCGESICFLFMGSNSCICGGCWILSRICCACNSLLAQGCKVKNHVHWFDIMVNCISTSRSHFMLLAFTFLLFFFFLIVIAEDPHWGHWKEKYH